MAITCRFFFYFCSLSDHYNNHNLWTVVSVLVLVVILWQVKAPICTIGGTQESGCRLGSFSCIIYEIQCVLFNLLEKTESFG
jgi:hypothetical protein